jgi:FixJ family two-component response regulator
VLNVFIIYVVEELRGRGYKGYIVGLTGNSESSMMESFMKAGANRMLLKPVQGKVLDGIVQGKIDECRSVLFV